MAARLVFLAAVFCGAARQQRWVSMAESREIHRRERPESIERAAGLREAWGTATQGSSALARRSADDLASILEALRRRHPSP